MQEVTDDYELVRPLGTGGFAKVFVGKNIHTEQDVAIKRIEMLKCGNIVLLDVEWYSCSAQRCLAPSLLLLPWGRSLCSNQLLLLQ